MSETMNLNMNSSSKTKPIKEAQAPASSSTGNSATCAGPISSKVRDYQEKREDYNKAFELIRKLHNIFQRHEDLSPGLIHINEIISICSRAHTKLLLSSTHQGNTREGKKSGRVRSLLAKVFSSSPPVKSKPDPDPVSVMAQTPSQPPSISSQASTISTQPPPPTRGMADEILINRNNLSNRLGQGGFGEVWRGNWNGAEVAVKIFTSSKKECEDAWRREKRVYETMRAHTDVSLGFLGSTTARGTPMERWIVTRYFHNKSLALFLTHNTISLSTMVKMVYSLVSGLGFLHSELQDDGDRNGVCHGDIKSANILVSHNHKCIFADFGHSTLFDRKTGKLDTIQKPGTVRYRAPEILNGGWAGDSFIKLKQADVYSLALVLWELLRRTRSADLDEEESYELPYHDSLENVRYPSEEKMKEIVCEKRLRPLISPRWSSNSVIQDVCKLMKLSWTEEPAERLSASQMKRNMLKLIITNEEEEDFRDVMNGAHLSTYK